MSIKVNIETRLSLTRPDHKQKVSSEQKHHAGCSIYNVDKNPVWKSASYT